MELTDIADENSIFSPHKEEAYEVTTKYSFKDSYSLYYNENNQRASQNKFNKENDFTILPILSSRMNKNNSNKLNFETNNANININASIYNNLVKYNATNAYKFLSQLKKLFITNESLRQIENKSTPFKELNNKNIQNDISENLKDYLSKMNYQRSESNSKGIIKNVNIIIPNYSWQNKKLFNYQFRPLTPDIRLISLKGNSHKKYIDLNKRNTIIKNNEKKIENIFLQKNKSEGIIIDWESFFDELSEKKEFLNINELYCACIQAGIIKNKKSDIESINKLARIASKDLEKIKVQIIKLLFQFLFKSSFETIIKLQEQKIFPDKFSKIINFEYHGNIVNFFSEIKKQLYNLFNNRNNQEKLKKLNSCAKLSQNVDNIQISYQKKLKNLDIILPSQKVKKSVF